MKTRARRIVAARRHSMNAGRAPRNPHLFVMGGRVCQKLRKLLDREEPRAQ
jgi:hypothetical protein